MIEVTLDYHPLSTMFRLIEGEEFDALVLDIKEQGLRHPITLFEGKILDGRNRYRACMAGADTPRFEDFAGDELGALAFVISENVRRRHLDINELAQIGLEALPAARLAARGRQSHGGTGPGRTLGTRGAQALPTETGRATQVVAKAVGISNATLKRADRIATDAPELWEKVKAKEFNPVTGQPWTIRAAANTLTAVKPPRRRLTPAKATELESRLAVFNQTRADLSDALEDHAIVLQRLDDRELIETWASVKAALSVDGDALASLIDHAHQLQHYKDTRSARGRGGSGD